MLRPAIVALSLLAVALVGVACGSDATDVASPGRTLYLQRCASCHGADRKGIATNPAMSVARMQELGDPAIRQILRDGGTTMPAPSPALTPAEMDALVTYLLTG